MAMDRPQPDLYDLVRERADPELPYLHLVGFKFSDSVPEETRAAFMEECNALKEACGGEEAGILVLCARRNIDDRKNVTWVEVAKFSDREAFLRFHAHPAHQAFANKLASLRDANDEYGVSWSTMDVVMDFPL